MVDQQRLQERIDDYQKACAQLRKALAQPRDEFIRDAIIQRFEFTYELAWKMLKLRLDVEGIDARTPRAVLQAALQAGFIDDGNGWSDLLRLRNLTSHTYDEALAEQVTDFVAHTGIDLFEALAARSVPWGTES